MKTSVCIKTNVVYFTADVTAQVVLSGHSKTRKGQTYIALEERKVGLQINGATMYFDNLFNGNKQLGKQ